MIVPATMATAFSRVSVRGSSLTVAQGYAGSGMDGNRTASEGDTIEEFVSSDAPAEPVTPAVVRSRNPWLPSVVQ